MTGIRVNEFNTLMLALSKLHLFLKPIGACCRNFITDIQE